VPKRQFQPNDGWLKTETFRELVAATLPTPTHKLVLFIFAGRQNKQPPLTQLANEVGISTRRLKAVIADLREAGVVVAHRNGRKTTYRVTLGQPEYRAPLVSRPTARPNDATGSTIGSPTSATHSTIQPHPKKRMIIRRIKEQGIDDE
jgi:hypothetical protein